MDLPVPEDDGAADHLPGTALPALEFVGTSGEPVRQILVARVEDVDAIVPLAPDDGPG